MSKRIARRIEACWAALTAAALGAGVFPVLALAQSAPRGSGAAPQAGDPVSQASGSANWWWILAAIVIIGLVWWALASRRHGTVAR